MKYIRRDIEEEIRPCLGMKEIIAVVGTRQCGKTTLIENLIKNLKKVNRVSFDDVKQLQLFENDIDSFIELNVRGYDYLFIDEVHYSKESGKKLKYIYDTQKIKVIISGSSAPELSIQSLKYLTGRIFMFNLFPFSFRELLRANEKNIIGLYDSGKYEKEILSRLNRHLEEFILYGGYPRAVTAKTKKEKYTVIRNIYNTYLLREIRDILGLSDNDRLVKLLKSLSLQIGNLLNYNELSSITGFSYRELIRYLHILEETYICKRVSTFHTNKRTELSKTPKIYFVDAGFRNMCIDSFNTERTDRGAMYENVIFSELLKKGIVPKFWRKKSGAEVDFVIENNEVIPVEVKTMLSRTKTTRSLHSFLEKYRPKRSYVTSLGFSGNRRINGHDVTFMPFTRFFVEKF